MDGSIWQPDFKAEFDRRGKNINKLAEHPELRGDWMLHYKHNPIDWINDWAITFDPRNKDPMPRLMPFKLFKRQEELVQFLLECWQDGESGLVEKCRDAGLTWICCAFSVWLWLFWDGSTIGWGSRKEEYVDDKDDPKAIFPKMRKIIEYLPRWMLPIGFEIGKHATYMKIINKANDSAITGEAGDNIGRGGRTSIYFKDESAHYPHPESVEAALGDNTNCQIDISSVNGTGNPFHNRRLAGTVWTPGCKIPKGKVRVFIFAWQDDPRKNQEWYDLRRNKAEAEALLHIFMQEVERNYSASIVGIIIPAEWVTACIDAHVKLASWGDWFSGEKVAGSDVADGGRDLNATVVGHGVVTIACQQAHGDADEGADIAVDMCRDNGIIELYYDCIGVGTGFKVRTNELEKQPDWPKHLRVFEWNASASPLDPNDPVIPGDEESSTNEDQYLNLKAQSWFRMRSRVHKTWQAVTKGKRYPIEEMCSFDSKMPLVHQMTMELSQPVKKTSQNGKTMVDKTPDDKKSPNLADACVMKYNPVRELSILDVL